MKTYLSEVTAPVKIFARSKSKNAVKNNKKVKPLSALLQKDKPNHTSKLIERLKLIKRKIQSLPNRQKYRIQDQVDYLRHMTEVIPLISHIRLQQIPYVITQDSFRKIAVQLMKQTSNKQIIICLIRELVKGFAEYSQILNKQVYDCLQCLIEMEQLSLNADLQLNVQGQTKKMSRQILRRSVIELVTQIIKWYRIQTSTISVSIKYEQLLIKMKQY